MISIHALREEGDGFASNHLGMVYEFLSTPSARRATPDWQRSSALTRNFYPRPPRGGRRAVVGNKLDVAVFLSTPSARRATVYGTITHNRARDFYPRPPRGGRRPGHQDQQGSQLISIHALREEGDAHSAYTLILVYKFLSTPSARRATHRWPDYG